MRSKVTGLCKGRINIVRAHVGQTRLYHMEVTTTSTSQWVYTKKHEPSLFLEKEIIHSCILAWEIPWTEEPSGLQPLGLQKSRTQFSNLTTKLCPWFTWHSLWTSRWLCSTQSPRYPDGWRSSLIMITGRGAGHHTRLWSPLLQKWHLLFLWNITSQN